MQQLMGSSHMPYILNRLNVSLGGNEPTPGEYCINSSISVSSEMQYYITVVIGSFKLFLGCLFVCV